MASWSTSARCKTSQSSNDGNRAATTPGYDASVDYVANRLRRAGYRVTLDAIRLPSWTMNGPSTFQRTDAGSEATYVEDTDYIVAQFSAAGDVTGPIFVAGNTELPEPTGGPGMSALAAASRLTIAGMPQGAIALIQRGTCPFTPKYQNALDAGAAAALIFNDGSEGREAPISTTGPRRTRHPRRDDQQ